MRNYLVSHEGVDLFVSDFVEMAFRSNKRFPESVGSVRIPHEVIKGHTEEELGEAVKECGKLIPVVRLDARVRNMYDQVSSPRYAPSEVVERTVKIFHDLSRWQRRQLSDFVLSRIGEVCAAYRQGDYGQRRPKVDSKDKKEKGYVYLAKAADKYKIGRSKVPDDRIKHFDTQMPIDVEEVLRFQADDYVSAEQQLHEWASERRVKGEWFDLTDEAVAILEDVAEYREGHFIGVHDQDSLNDVLETVLS